MRRLTGRSARLTVAGAVAVGVLSAFAAVAGVGLSQIRSDEYGEYQYGGKVVICHHTHSKKHPFVTLSVGAKAAEAHVKRHTGDHLGRCSATELAPQSKAKPKHGANGHERGQGNGKQGAENPGKGHGKGRGK
jgi:hypothetical protein